MIRAIDACAVCFEAASASSRTAYYGTTVFMIVLPLALLGILALWVARATRRSAAEGGSASPDLEK